MKLRFQLGALPWLWVSVVIIVLDRITKYLAEKHLMAYFAHPVIPFLNFRLAYNRGAAFSFLDRASGWQGWLFGTISIVVSISILIWMQRLQSKQRWLAISLALIVGGAVGNLIDRLLYGRVIDFIELYVGRWYWPSFNIADSAICIGAVMLVLHTVVHRKS